ncbi:trehalase-like [Pogonomyrmex barbatus]|uniref:Trehalase n=1 Tax=Pogonomyrmex barbatus TaxID=144034 RepID=A0A6I9WPJ7_9HYME|nr:trehalase-like [Pogonomyrmex barbatus]
MKATNNSPNRTEIAAFVAENFATQDELDNSTLPDWKENPTILKFIQDPQFREWARRLNYIWKTLARKINGDLVVNPQRHSLIYVNNTFVIPGGRFKEFYYWDSYWIIEGLLLCDMPVTVKGMIENFLSMVERYGFVPNGGRVYYLSRSQPPLLIPMVAKYYERTMDRKFLKKNIAILETEFEYWQNEKTVDVKKDGKTYKMARYVVNSRGPRPESYKEDYQLAQQLPEQDQRALYNDLKAAAESGWDFSYRWCIQANRDKNLSLLNVSTSDIIPVDLNAILQRNARMLAYFHGILGNLKVSLLLPHGGARFSNSARARARARAPVETVRKNVRKRYACLVVGGTPTSVNYTGEQWDFPNAWPPLQSFLILGLHHTKVKEAVAFARTLAGRWLRSNYLGYDEYGKMFEKYNAIHPGEGGSGGEYNVQEGFGWTNGIVFEFLRLFPDAKSVDDTVFYDGNGIER